MSRPAMPPVPEVTPAQLSGRLGTGDAPLLLDVRTAEERAIARIDPSLHIGLDEFVARALAEIDSGTEVVVYCHTGVRSEQVARWMSANGWSAVSNLRGGIDAWSCEIDPAVPRY